MPGPTSWGDLSQRWLERGPHGAEVRVEATPGLAACRYSFLQMVHRAPGEVRVVVQENAISIRVSCT